LATYPGLKLISANELKLWNEVIWLDNILHSYLLFKISVCTTNRRSGTV